MDVREIAWQHAIEQQRKATKYTSGEFYLVLALAAFAFLISLAAQGVQP